MRSVARAVLGYCCLFTVLLPLACGNRFRPMESHDVAATADPNATYAAVMDTLQKAGVQRVGLAVKQLG